MLTKLIHKSRVLDYITRAFVKDAIDTINIVEERVLPPSKVQSQDGDIVLLSTVTGYAGLYPFVKIETLLTEDNQAVVVVKPYDSSYRERSFLLSDLELTELMKVRTSKLFWKSNDIEHYLYQNTSSSRLDFTDHISHLYEESLNRYEFGGKIKSPGLL